MRNSNKLDINFSDILVGFQTEKSKMQKPRTYRRISTFIPVFIEIKGQILEANLVDASEKVVRLDTAFPLGATESCIITLKSQPHIQLIASPIITNLEYERHGWNRLKLKATLDLEKLQALFSDQATAV